MKVAICLSGTMSKIGDSFLTQNSLYNSNPYINFNTCYGSIKKHIINVNSNCEFDFFIHSWNMDLEHQLNALYSPKKSLFENNELYNDEINSKIKIASDFAGISKSLSMKKSILLLEQYQQEISFQYDLIIIYRPDIVLLKDMNLQDYDCQKIYANSFANGNGDFHFIMNSDNLKLFKNLYDSLDKGNRQITHFWIKNYVNNFMGKEITEDNIIAGTDQEVIRKIYIGSNPNITMQTLLQYDLEYKMSEDNIYTKMQRDHYNSTADIMAIENHRGHDSNPDYYGILLKDIVDSPENWKDKKALDFGCGVGRNIDNLLKLSKWKTVDGCDISSENLIRADRFLINCNYAPEQYRLYTTTGTTLAPLKDQYYDFVMSTIVLQHIAVHEIRSSLFTDIYRVMKTGALFSFQMAQYNNELKKLSARYHDNAWNATGTNGAFDVSVDDPKDLINDLSNIGYKNISYEIGPEWDAYNKCYVKNPSSKWIYVKASK